jgi:hypothetical protein
MSISPTDCIRPSTSLPRPGTVSTPPTAVAWSSSRCNRAETRPTSASIITPALGFVTNYNHIAEVQVAVGDFVREGEPFAEVSAVPDDPTLHFELWAVLDREAAEEGPPGDSDMVPIDPTRALYAWERRLTTDEPLAGSQVPIAVGVTRVNTVHFFFARFEEEITLYVPVYEPMTADERLIVGLLREAHRRGDALELSFRHSSFWGVDVATQAELA